VAKIFSRLCTAAAIAAVLVAAGLGTAARIASAHVASARPDASKTTLIVARDLSDTKTLDPGQFYEFSAYAAGGNIFETLVQYHGADVAHIKPMLATSWKITQGGKVFTFNLRHNVRFSTGNPMTAADVVFSYRRLAYLKGNASFLMGVGVGSTGDVTKAYPIKATGKYTVQISLPAPDVSFLAQLTTLNFAVIDSKVAKAHGADDSADASTKDAATNYLNEHSLGTGPFVLQSWVRGAAGSITLVPNKFYWGKKPYLQKILFQGVLSPAAQRLEVQKGTVDVAQTLSIDDVKALKGNSSVKVIHGNSLDLLYLAMTTNPEISAPMANPLVRQAIRHAIDYHGMIHGLLSDIGAQPNGMIPVGLSGNDPKTNAKLLPKYSVSTAKNLLKQAGYPNGFSVDFFYPSPNVFDGINFDLIMPKLQHDLAAVGINATLKPEAETPVLADYRAQKLPMLAFEWGVDYPDSNDFAGPFSPGGNVAHRMWWDSNPTLTALAQKADVTTNLTKRAGIYEQIEKIWLKQSAFAPIVQPQNIIVLHKGITGYVYSPLNQQGDFRYVKKS
jgi:peptide/nickel transport system substrate-binding protein